MSISHLFPGSIAAGEGGVISFGIQRSAAFRIKGKPPACLIIRKPAKLLLSLRHR